MPWGTVFKFGTNVHLDSKMNWFDFGAWRSNVKVTVTSCYCECDILGLPLGNFITSDTIHLDSLINQFDFSGQSSKVKVTVPSQKHVFWHFNVGMYISRMLEGISSALSLDLKDKWLCLSCQRLQWPLYESGNLNRYRLYRVTSCYPLCSS